MVSIKSVLTSPWVTVLVFDALLLCDLWDIHDGADVLCKTGHFSNCFKGTNVVPPRGFVRIHKLDLDFKKINN